LRRELFWFVALLLLVQGCSERLSKEQYYQKGLSFLEKNNAGGAIVAFKKAIEMDPDYFEARYELSKAYLRKRKYEAAEREARKALHLNPSLSEARLVLGEALVKNKKYDEAIAEMRKFPDGAEKNAVAAEILASAYIGKKEFDKSERLLMDILRRVPDRVSAMNWLAKQYLMLNRNSAATDYIDKVLKIDPENRKALYMLAELNKKKQSVDGVIDAYKRILKIDPNDFNAAFQLGFAYLVAKDINNAKIIAAKLIKYPKRAEGKYLTGITLFYEKNYDDAAVLLQAVANSAAVPGAQYYLGLIHVLNERLEQAASEFQKVVDMMPDLLQARLLLAVTHLRKGRADKAASEAREVIHRDYNNAFAHSLLGSAYLAMGEAGKASEEFDRATELDPGLVNAYLKKGIMHFVSGNNASAEQELITAVEVSPGSVDARILLAQFYIRNKKFEEAIKVLNDGIEQVPDDAMLYNVMGAAYAGAMDMDNAERYFEKAVAANRRFFLPHLNLARLYLNTGDRDRAVTEYKKVLEIDNENILALLMLAKISEDLGQFEESVGYYRRAVATGETGPVIAFAGYYLRRGKTADAMKVIDSGLKASTWNVNLLDMKGNIYFRNGEYENALTTFRKMYEISPEIGAVRIADINAARGDYSAAISVLEDVVNKEPGDIQVYKKLYDLALRAGKSEAAERYARKIIETDPDRVFGYNLLAELYIADGRIRDASHLVDKALSMHPDDLRTEVLKGRILMVERKYVDALKHFRNLRKSHNNYAPLYFMEASTLEVMGRTKEAITLYQKTLEISPEYVPALNNLAYLFAEGYGPVDKAEEMALRARTIASHEGSIADTLGWVYYKKGEYDKAIENFSFAYERMPGSPAVNLHLGLAYLMKGDKIEARKYLEAVLTINGGTAKEVSVAEHFLKELN
jgi:putative PEP-CTERM system TPR-repeat lipoprotein